MLTLRGLSEVANTDVFAGLQRAVNAYIAQRGKVVSFIRGPVFVTVQPIPVDGKIGQLTAAAVQDVLSDIRQQIRGAAPAISVSEVIRQAGTLGPFIADEAGAIYDARPISGGGGGGGGGGSVPPSPPFAKVAGNGVKIAGASLLAVGLIWFATRM